jgi:hypothetical protein
MDGKILENGGKCTYTNVKSSEAAIVFGVLLVKR